MDSALHIYCDALKIPAVVDTDINMEMAKLAQNVKSRVRILLEHGLTEEASEALQQLKTLVSEDEEMRELENMTCESVNKMPHE